MRRRLVGRPVGAVAALAMTLATAAPAQETLRFRFSPPSASPVALAFQTHTRTLGSNGRAYEFADVGVMTEVWLGTLDSVHVLHLTYDSVRVRAREGSGAWREFALPPSDSLWMQLRLNDRLQLLEANGRRLPSFTDPLAVVTGMRGLVLPQRGLRAGDQWRGRIAIALPRSPTDPGMRSLASLQAEAVLTLDSVVPRANDTLGYVSATGRVERTTVVDPYGQEPTRWEFAGEVSAALIWSTGWNVFVSGLNRYRVRARRPPAPADSAAVTLEWETTTRYQVRP